MFEELRHEIDRVMKKLPQRCKEVFYMSRFEGLNIREIAERTGTSTQNVEKHIARALTIFSRHFSGLDISPAGLVKFFFDFRGWFSGLLFVLIC